MGKKVAHHVSLVQKVEIATGNAVGEGNSDRRPSQPAILVRIEVSADVYALQPMPGHFTVPLCTHKRSLLRLTGQWRQSTQTHPLKRMIADASLQSFTVRLYVPRIG